MNEVASAVIGRDSEAARIEAFLRDAADGTAGLLIEGEAGAGKTTLLHACLERASGMGRTVLSCRPVQSEARLSYAGLGDLIEPVLDPLLDQLPDPQRHALEVALLRRGSEGSARDRRTVGAGTRSVLLALAGAGPTVVAVDDLQWLDRSSARALAFAMRRLGGQRLRFVASVRTGAAAPVRAEEFLSDASRLERMTAGPLSAGALERLLRTRLGARLSRPGLLKLHSASGGNPFFALELARAQLARGEGPAAGEPLALPEDLRALVGARLARLPARTRDILLLAALLRTPSEGSLSAAGAREADLDPAVISGIVTVDGGRVRFTHPLLAAGVVDGAPPGRRRDAHRRLAAVVKRSEERARHQALGTVGPDAAVARQLEDAAGEARARGAPDAAAELAEQAAALTPTSDLAAALRRKVIAADEHFRAGDTLRAQVLMDEAVGAMAAGPERANVLWRLGRIRYMAEAFPAAERLFVRALEEAGEDQALRAALESAIAFSAFIQGDIHRARDHAERARELAEGIGHPEVLGPALATVGLTRFLLARGIDHALMERALALDEAADTPVEWRPRFTYAWMKLSADDLPGARVLFQALRAKAVELGDEGSLPTLLVFLSLLECRAGDWTLADLYAGEGMEASNQAGQEQTRVWALYARSAVDACFGRLDREVALDGLAMAERTGAVFPVTLFLSVLGFDALSRGDHAEAHRRLGPLTDAVKTMGVLEPGPFRFLADEIEALVALGRLDEAASLAAQLEESGRRLRRPWALAAGARCRGLVLAARSDLDGALSVFDRALERHRDLGQPFELGRTLLAKGQVERRARKWGASRRSLTEARSIFHDLGAEAWAARARDELRRIGGRVPTPAELSETERRVAQLVSTGRSNKEVAAALFMAPKTVSDNLARIYRKLGVSSRTELAARMADGTTARSGN